ncbi:T9SS type A sorting domain-containing protein [Gaetbulibacter jejuensis]|uniref:Secretion system C-terminal sorting domain-containing protein n=1 Tax=Gaetbulibacter jejuensis TaxID=584607 RepID=A0ABP3V6M6_9FLAO
MNKCYFKNQSKSIVGLLVVFFLVTTLSAQPAIGTTTFDGSNANVAAYDLLPRNGSLQGWSFFVDGEGSGSINHNGANSPNTVTVFAQQATTLNMASDDGSEFNLDSIIIQWFSFLGNFTMTSYRDGNSIGAVVLSASSSFSDYDLSNNDDFKNIDEIRMTGFSNSNITAIIDEITISTATLSIDTIRLNQNNMSIFPNPTSDVLMVKSIKNITHFKIVDIKGRLIKQGSIDQNNSVVNLKGVDAGLYILQLDDEKPIKVIKN